MKLWPHKVAACSVWLNEGKSEDGLREHWWLKAIAKSSMRDHYARARRITHDKERRERNEIAAQLRMAGEAGEDDAVGPRGKRRHEISELGI